MEVYVTKRNSRKRALLLYRQGAWIGGIQLGRHVNLGGKGVCKTQYAEEIISCVSKHGPYIVLVPGLAMPHSTENAEAIETTIGFMKTEKMVHFLKVIPEKDANVFFTPSSTNPEEHHKNMQRLYTILTNEEALEALKHVKTVEDLLAIDQMLED